MLQCWKLFFLGDYDSVIMYVGVGGAHAFIVKGLSLSLTLYEL